MVALLENASNIWEVTNASPDALVWIRSNSNEFAVFGTYGGIDITFSLSADAKLEELLNMNSN